MPHSGTIKGLKTKDFQQTLEIGLKSKIQTDIYCPNQPIIKLYQSVGMLRAIWFNDYGQKISINSGTAIALTKRILLTCQHNLYHQKKRRYLDQFLFFPNSNGSFGDQSKKYKNANFSFFMCQYADKSFSAFPLSEQVTLIVLEKDLNIQNFIRIGNLQMHKKMHLEILGYPNTHYYNQFNQEKIMLEPKHLKGQFLQIENHIIHHNMLTSSGHSGSPILATLPSGEQIIVGLHTHKRSDGIGSGIFFTKQIIKNIKMYQTKLINDHNLKDRIQFLEDEQIQSIKQIFTCNQSYIEPQKYIETLNKKYSDQQDSTYNQSQFNQLEHYSDFDSETFISEQQIHEYAKIQYDQSNLDQKYSSQSTQVSQSDINIVKNSLSIKREKFNCYSYSQQIDQSNYQKNLKRRRNSQQTLSERIQKTFIQKYS